MMKEFSFLGELSL